MLTSDNFSGTLGSMKSWDPERAQKLIEQEGRTRKWLASQCGIVPSTISHYLAGRRSPSTSVLKLMAAALNTTEGFLSGQEKDVKRRAVG